MWVLSIVLGALWWVTLQHLVNANWSVVVRRVGELLAANMPSLGLLALPIVIPVVIGKPACSSRGPIRSRWRPSTSCTTSRRT